jgi:hypothetical protein
VIHHHHKTLFLEQEQQLNGSFLAYAEYTAYREGYLGREFA